MPFNQWTTDRTESHRSLLEHKRLAKLRKDFVLTDKRAELFRSMFVKLNCAGIEAMAEGNYAFGSVIFDALSKVMYIFNLLKLSANGEASVEHAVNAFSENDKIHDFVPQFMWELAGKYIRFSDVRPEESLKATK